MVRLQALSSLSPLVHLVVVMLVLARQTTSFARSRRLLQHCFFGPRDSVAGGGRRRGLLQQAIGIGEWVLLKDSGRKAQVLSANKGWLRVKEEGNDRVLSIRGAALTELESRTVAPKATTSTAMAMGEARSNSKSNTGNSSIGVGGDSTSDSTYQVPSRFEDGPKPNFMDATLRHPMHAATQEWIVFSDLHCSIQTLPTCLEVLKHVHREAQARGAGIIFLGDFFHIRGAIRVDLLNSIMADLGKWTQPVIFIPGNHDQVTLDGAVHALTPLGFAVGSASEGGLRGTGGPLQGQAVVITRPTVFLNALWLPYARDSALTRSVLAPYHLQREHDDDYYQALVSAVFCHVDVRGAPMNDNTASRRGLRPSVFPPHLPTFSGHFHKPHRVPRTSITYIGSPYQVSLAEAGQRKRFLLLRSPLGPGLPWTEVGDIDIDVGRRYFRPRSLDAAYELLSEGYLRKGDRVVLNLMPDAAEKMSKEVDGLRAKLIATVQAELEVREGMVEEEDGLRGREMLEGPMGGEGGREGRGGLMDFETLGTTAVWRAYMAESAASTATEGGSSSCGIEKLFEGGMQLIEAWEASTDKGETISPSAHAAAVTPTTAGGGSTRTVRLEFEKVKVAGYGPFLKAVEYPLAGRGLVLLRGKNMDDPGAESNAAGKSKLAMAAQWALTGEGDEKPVTDSKVTDVAFDVLSRGKAAYAEVTVWGSVNKVPFQVIRKRGLKTNQLRFVLDGEDLTRQTSRDTQSAMEEALGLDMDFLSLAIFCGQHQMNGLLEATDVRLKERLSKIVRLGVWEDLKETAKKMAKGYVEQGLDAQTQVRVCELDLERQELEEAELLELLSTDISNNNSSSSSSGGAQLLGCTIRTLDQVEMELGKLSRQVEEARAAWKESLERREEWARGQAEAGQSAGIRRERLRSLQVGLEEDKQAVAVLEDRWDPNLYWAESQRWGVVGKEDTIDPALGLAFAAHVRVEEWQEKVATVEAERAKCLAEIGAAGGDLKKVEGALNSLVMGEKREGLEEEEEGVDGCPTCGRAWEEGGVDAKAKAISHLEGEIAKCRLILMEAEEKKPRLEKQKLVLTRMAEAHVQYLRDVRDWQALCQRLQTRGRELVELQNEIAEGEGVPLWTEEEQVQPGQRQDQPVDELAHREREFRTLQEQFNKLQDERPRLIQQAAELQARERVASEIRKRLGKKREELTKAREALEAIRAIQAEQEEKALLLRALIERFGMRGVQAFVLRGAVAQLERLANRFLAILSEGGLRLGLSLDGEKIMKEVKVRGGDGVFLDRSLSHLSGGQWRRASLAALMAFRELSRLRSRVDCNLIVLDEVLNHLDGAGRARVGKLLRAMVQGGREDGESEEEEEEGGDGQFEGHSTGIDTAIVILQDLAAFELEDTFDFVDEVVKEGDVSRVALDERHEMHVEWQQKQQQRSQQLAFENKKEEEKEEEGKDDDVAGSPIKGGGGGGSVSLNVKEEDVWNVDVEVMVSPSIKDEQAQTKARVKQKRKKQQQQQLAEEKPEAATRVVKGGWLDGMEEIAIK